METPRRRVYGRRLGHRLRPGRQALLARALPGLRNRPARGRAGADRPRHPVPDAAPRALARDRIRRRRASRPSGPRQFPRWASSAASPSSRASQRSCAIWRPTAPPTGSASSPTTRGSWSRGCPTPASGGCSCCSPIPWPKKRHHKRRLIDGRDACRLRARAQGRRRVQVGLRRRGLCGVDAHACGGERVVRPARRGSGRREAAAGRLARDPLRAQGPRRRAHARPPELCPQGAIIRGSPARPGRGPSGDSP